ncbi:MAG: hypothetical protein HYZ87_01300, partial [Candidatus Omnitrophica bacterium]|nr:hypothetical protein [Candidatus Omnitrophota bacterium]
MKHFASKIFPVFALILAIQQVALPAALLAAESQATPVNEQRPTLQTPLSGANAAVVANRQALEQLIAKNPEPVSRNSTPLASLNSTAIPVVPIEVIAYPIQYPLPANGTVTFANGVSVEIKEGALVDIYYNERSILTIITDASDAMQRLGTVSSGSVSYSDVIQAENILRYVIDGVQNILGRLNEALGDSIIPQNIIDPYQNNVLTRVTALQSQVNAYRSAAQYVITIPTTGYACAAGTSDPDCVLRTPASGLLTVYVDMRAMEEALSQAVSTSTNGAIFFEGLTASGYDSVLAGIDSQDIAGLLSLGQMRASENVDTNRFTALYGRNLTLSYFSNDQTLGEVRKLIARLIQGHVFRLVAEIEQTGGARVGFADANAFVNQLLGTHTPLTVINLPGNGLSVTLTNGVITDVSQNGQSILTTLSQVRSSLLSLPSPNGLVDARVVFEQAEPALRYAVGRVQEILQTLDQSLGDDYFIESAVTPFHEEVLRRTGELRALVNSYRAAPQVRLELPSLWPIPVVVNISSLVAVLAQALVDRFGGALAFEGYPAASYLALPRVSADDIAGLLSNIQFRNMENVDQNFFAALYEGNRTYVQFGGDNALAEYAKLAVRLIRKFGVSVVEMRVDPQGYLMAVVNPDLFYRAIFGQAAPPLPSFIRQVNPSGASITELVQTLINKYLKAFNRPYSGSGALPVFSGGYPFSLSPTAWQPMPGIPGINGMSVYRSFPDPSNPSIAVYVTVYNRLLKPGVNMLSVSDFTIWDKNTGESWIYIGNQGRLYRSRQQDSVVLPNGSRLTFNAGGALSTVRNADGSQIQLVYTNGHVTEFVFIQTNGRRTTVTVDPSTMDKIKIPDKYGYFLGSRRFSTNQDPPAFSTSILSDPMLLMDIRSLEAAVRDVLVGNPTIQALTLKGFKLERLLCTADIPISI